MRTTRRRFLALCLAVASTPTLPSILRLRALSAYAVASFSFTAAERAVLRAAANTVIPGATVRTRYGLRDIPAAGDAGAVDFIENLVTGSLIFAAGTQRPDYSMPPGTHAVPFPAAGALDLRNPPLSEAWAVKQVGWWGSGPTPPHRPFPPELPRLQALYRTGIAALNTAVQPAFATFDAAPSQIRELVLRQLQAQEVGAYNADPASTDPYQGAEGNQPFFLTLLDHVCQACFGDPAYGGNGANDPTGKARWVYWKMVGFIGPSYTGAGGPGPHQGWTAEQMSGPFEPTIPF